jgi:peptidoglycan-N-acetylmuramic acid deacetylase
MNRVMRMMNDSANMKKRRRIFFLSLLTVVVLTASLLAYIDWQHAEPAKPAKPQVKSKVIEKLKESEPANTDPPVTTSPTIKPTPLDSLSKTPISWYYMKKGAGIIPDFPLTPPFRPEQNVKWIGSGKTVYLTIDMGADLGDPERWLATMAKHGVKATYFVTGENIRRSPDLIRKLLANGHEVANHSLSHPDFTTLSDEQARAEINDTAALYREVTGKEPIKLFRFPYGKYSDRLLSIISEMGYTSVFWSTAMKDWVPRENGSKDVVRDIMGNLHDGNIILMHQASADNINALDELLQQIKAKGYQFALVGE